MNKIAVSVIAVSVLIGLTPLALDKTLTQTDTISFEANATSIPAEGQDNHTLGVSADSDLGFGTVPGNSQVNKTLNLSTPRTSHVKLSTSGNISESLRVWDDELVFEGTEYVTVSFKASEPGYYTGSVDAKVRVPKNQMGEKWINLKYSLY